MATMPTTYRWRRALYDRAVERGAFEDQRVELIDGEIVEMAPIGPRHAAVNEGTREALATAFRAHVRTKKSLALGEWDEPQPDVAVVVGGWRDYLPAHPSPDQTVLVVEIADTTREYDLGRKADIYAAANIQEYWVVCPGEGEVVVCRDRRPARTSTTTWTYADRRVLSRGATIQPLQADAAIVAVADLLP